MNSAREVRCQITGKEYVFLYTWGSICQLEVASGKSFPDIAELLRTQKMSFTLIRQLIWAGLQAHHKDVTIDKIGEWEPVDVTPAIAAATQALMMQWPDTTGADETARPPKATSGTSKGSSSRTRKRG